MKLDRKDFEKRFNDIKTEFSSHSSTLKEISEYQCPTRGAFDLAPGTLKKIDYKKLLDSTAVRCGRNLSSGLMAGVASPSSPWFKLTISDKDLANWKPVKLYLDTVQDRMMDVFARSNIYGVLHNTFSELGPFGVGAMALLSDYKTIARGQSFTVGEYFLGVDHDGRVNTFGREFSLKVGQLVSKYGIENVSQKTKDAYNQKKVDSWVKVKHLIQPNYWAVDGVKDNKNMPYISVTWEDGSEADRFLNIGGFKRFPVQAPRWATRTTTDAYGFGPGWDAHGDVKMLQKLQKDKLLALDKIINPPMKSMGERDIDTLPGGVTVVDPSQQAGLGALYQINPDLNAVTMEIRNTQQAIERCYMNDLFLMFAESDRRQITLGEIMEKKGEKLLMIGPTLERLESEQLDPMIENTYGIMEESGVLPEAPAELNGVDIKIEYISTLAQAQKMVKTTSIEQAVGFVGNMAAAFPEVLHVIDPDEALRSYASSLGVDPKIIKSKEEVEQKRQEIQKQQAQQQMQQQQMINAQAMVQGAKTLSDTKMDQGSALDALMGGGM